MICRTHVRRSPFWSRPGTVEVGKSAGNPKKSVASTRVHVAPDPVGHPPTVVALLEAAQAPKQDAATSAITAICLTAAPWWNETEHLAKRTKKISQAPKNSPLRVHAEHSPGQSPWSCVLPSAPA